MGKSVERATSVAKKSGLTLEELRAGAGHQRMRPNPVSVVKKPSPKPQELTPVQVTAARMYASGKSIPEIARKLADHIIKDESHRPTQLKRSRQALRRWALKQGFRDEVYNHTIVLLDLESPAIVRGVARKAKEGRVDAARLTLELNGRHSPHAEEKAANIVIAFQGMPRPPMIEAMGDADDEIEDADIEEL